MLFLSVQQATLASGQMPSPIAVANEVLRCITALEAWQEEGCE